MIIQFGTVVGIDKQGNDNTYRVIIANGSSKAKDQYTWKFDCVMWNEQQVKASLAKGNKWLNIKLEDGKIKGSTGALNRFETKPFVILTQLSSQDGKLLGYKVANYDGGVKNITIKEMLAFGNRMTKQNRVPVQNAIFVKAEGDKKEHFKSYPNAPFLNEVLITNKNKYSEVKKSPVRENQKTLKRLDEIYTKPQLIQLKLGKEHGVDIRVFANPALSAEKMKILREGLEQKINVRPIAFNEYTEKAMLFYIDCLEEGLNIRNFLNPKYTLCQLCELSLAEEMGLDISKMSNPKLSASEMAEIRERLENNIWKDELVKKDGSWI